MTGSEESQVIPVEKLQRANKLNDAFRKGRQAWEVLEDLQAIKKPILVDFNNVLANNNMPLIPNPEGKQFLSALRNIGDVIIATTARGWDPVHDFLQNSGMWSDEIILMVSPNWKFLSNEAYGETKSAKDRLMTAFERNLSNRGIEFDTFYHRSSPVKKPLSPLFDKPFDIPLIDDSAMATLKPYPGILGIHVQPFMDDIEREYMISDSGIPLPKAVEKVQEHYSPVVI